jgi:hypothetical protein
MYFFKKINLETRGIPSSVELLVFVIESQCFLTTELVAVNR